ncbi:MAG: MarR family winged helix-turn-helix transcriptional regulator [Christensenellaceae bacterium]|jgi:DNA-binding MarR family transcriptional regulator
MMLDVYGNEINEAFQLIYDSVHKVEERMLKTSSNLDLSISELDILGAIGKYKEEGCSISQIAKEVGVTLPTITVAIQRLEARGYVEKKKSMEDGRRVNIVLTKLGKKADAAHRYFHERMVRAFLKEVGEDVKPVLLTALQNLATFLRQMGDR